MRERSTFHAGTRRIGSRCCLATLVVAAACMAVGPVAQTSAASSGETPAGPFAGTWYGHTRSLVIHRGGRATESVGSGCCDPTVDLSFRLTAVTGSSTRATARIRVTEVVIRDPDAFSDDEPAPRVGQRGTLRLRDGVITEPASHTTYCDEEAGTAGKCGA